MKDSLIDEPGPWEFGFGGFGEMPAEYDNLVAIHPTLRDKWGFPHSRSTCTWRENELTMREDMAQTPRRCSRRRGQDVQPSTRPAAGVLHPRDGHRADGTRSEDLGAQRLEPVHAFPNVFVTDGACMTSSARQNPSITYMALTARACYYAVRQIARHEL